MHILNRIFKNHLLVAFLCQFAKMLFTVSFRQLLCFIHLSIELKMPHEFSRQQSNGETNIGEILNHA